MSGPALLDDFKELELFAEQDVKRHARSVRRWIDMPDGLPYTRLGNRIMIHVPTARAWLLGRVSQRKPRRRGLKTPQQY